MGATERATRVRPEPVRHYTRLRYDHIWERLRSAGFCAWHDSAAAMVVWNGRLVDKRRASCSLHEHEDLRQLMATCTCDLRHLHFDIQWRLHSALRGSNSG